MHFFLSTHPAFPEMLLLGGTLLILLIDLFLQDNKTATFWLAEILLAFTLFAVISLKSSSTILLFEGHFISDTLSVLLKAFAIILTMLILAYARARDEFASLRSEYILLILLALLGAMVLISAASLITLYLGLELLSLPIYALVALKRDCVKGGEAAIKYFVMGALASGFLLYGFSLLYGLTGSLLLSVIAGSVFHGVILSTAFAVAAIMIFVAIAFKLSIVPFHLWAADVYEGAPLSVTPFIASVSKIAVIGLFMRLFIQTFNGQVPHLQNIMFVLGILSLLIGSSAALMQKNIRKFLGYSTVANMGIVFLALSAGTAPALVSALFYVFAYSVSTVALFGLLLTFERDIVLIEDLKGLHAAKPFTAFLFLLVLLSFAGIPPLLGFDGKLMVLMALIHSHHIPIAIVMLVLSVISAGYVLRIIKTIYFENGEGQFNPRPAFGHFCAIINSLAVLVLGMFPSTILVLITRIFS